MADPVAPRVTYISWAESCSRSDHTARELGGCSHMVYRPQFGSRASTVLFKYLGQWMETARILRRERPDVVFVMVPPIVAALPAFWYAWRHRKQVVLDAHTAAFLHARWRRLQWLQRALSRRAATTIVHNDHLARLVRDAGNHATVVRDVPIVFPEREPFARPPGFVVAIVCSFNDDEPLAAMLEAARALPDVHFFMTGNPRHFPPQLAAERPQNVMLTGFLSTPAYGGLISGADAVMTLTTRDHTMLRGAYEAIYQGTPVIVSNWPLLREAFDQGAIHVDNSATQIAAAIIHMRDQHREYREQAAMLRQKKLAHWATVRDQILASIRAVTTRRRATTSQAVNV